MNYIISKQLLYSAVKFPRYYDFADRIANEYRRSQKVDTVLFGGSLLKENPGCAVAVVSNPITAVLCRLLYVQPYKGAAVPVWVATCGERLNNQHIELLADRDCYFYPTAQQYPKWIEQVINNRMVFGNVALVDNGLLLAHDAIPDIITSDTDLQAVVLQPYEVILHYCNMDLISFYKYFGGYPPVKYRRETA